MSWRTGKCCYCNWYVVEFWRGGCVARKDRVCFEDDKVVFRQELRHVRAEVNTLQAIPEAFFPCLHILSHIICSVW